MMRNSWQKFSYLTALMVLLAIAITIAVSEEGVPPGGAAGGSLLLGEKDISLSIDTSPAGGKMILLQDQAVTCQDSIVISADDAWKLTVEDTNAGSSTCDGKMRRGSSSGESSGWNYDDPDKPLTENFKVLVNGIGDNGKLQNVVLNDCNDLSAPGTIVSSSAASTSSSVSIEYSQKAVEGDAAGAYRIDLKYTLSSNI